MKTIIAITGLSVALVSCGFYHARAARFAYPTAQRLAALFGSQVRPSEVYVDGRPWTVVPLGIEGREGEPGAYNLVIRLEKR